MLLYCLKYEIKARNGRWVRGQERGTKSWLRRQRDFLRGHDQYRKLRLTKCKK